MLAAPPSGRPGKRRPAPRGLRAGAVGHRIRADVRGAAATAGTPEAPPPDKNKADRGRGADAAFPAAGRQTGLPATRDFGHAVPRGGLPADRGGHRRAQTCRRANREIADVVAESVRFGATQGVMIRHWAILGDRRVIVQGIAMNATGAEWPSRTVGCAPSTPRGPDEEPAHAPSPFLRLDSVPRTGGAAVSPRPTATPGRRGRPTGRAVPRPRDADVPGPDLRVAILPDTPRCGTRGAVPGAVPTRHDRRPRSAAAPDRRRPRRSSHRSPRRGEVDRHDGRRGPQGAEAVPPRARNRRSRPSCAPYCTYRHMLAVPAHTVLSVR